MPLTPDNIFTLIALIIAMVVGFWIAFKAGKNNLGEDLK